MLLCVGFCPRNLHVAEKIRIRNADTGFFPNGDLCKNTFHVGTVRVTRDLRIYVRVYIITYMYSTRGQSRGASVKRKARGVCPGFDTSCVVMQSLRARVCT